MLATASEFRPNKKNSVAQTISPLTMPRNPTEIHLSFKPPLMLEFQGETWLVLNPRQFPKGYIQSLRNEDGSFKDKELEQEASKIHDLLEKQGLGSDEGIEKFKRMEKQIVFQWLRRKELSA